MEALGGAGGEAVQDCALLTVMVMGVMVMGGHSIRSRT